MKVLRSKDHNFCSCCQSMIPVSSRCDVVKGFLVTEACIDSRNHGVKHTSNLDGSYIEERSGKSLSWSAHAQVTRYYITNELYIFIYTLDITYSIDDVRMDDNWWEVKHLKGRLLRVLMWSVNSPVRSRVKPWKYWGRKTTTSVPVVSPWFLYRRGVT